MDECSRSDVQRSVEVIDDRRVVSVDQRRLQQEFVVGRFDEI
jgi:hypothetical protein